MKQPKILSQILALLAIVSVITVGGQVLAQRAVTAGYGYGTCTTVAPTGLRAKNTVSKQTSVILRWQEVDFSTCGTHATTASYTVKVYKAEGGLVKTYTGVTDETLSIARGVLKPNSNYKYKVKAIASDTTESAWSRYKLFHTLPAKAKKIVVTNVTNTSADISWANIARSKSLKYYQVIVRQGKNVAFSTTVNKNLTQPRTGITATGLTPNTNYVVKIRAVYTKKITGKAGSTTFKTKAGNSTVIL